MSSTFRITEKMQLDEAISAMSNQNPGAILVLTTLLQDDRAKGMFAIGMLDSLSVYDEKIYKLWFKCCMADIKKMKKVLFAVRECKISEEEFQKTLEAGNSFCI